MDKKYFSKRQRHMKKWIPVSVYCHGRNGVCPFWHRLYSKYDSITYSYLHKREECMFADVCEEDCNQCQETVSRCDFLNYIEYGDYPLGDMCKVCGVKDRWE